jgi:hypothetical protein
VRRRIASGLLGAYVLVLGLANVGVEPAERVAAAAGLEQAWSVFAPEPLQHEVVLEADVGFADGGRAVWRPPRRGPGAAPIGYRLEMWTLRIVRDADSELWRPAARWIARRYADGGQRPVSVTLRRRWRAVPRPGQTRERRIWNEFDFYTLDVREER